eukprot:scaffold80148_cov52-Attheya_sp.AAC.1
MAFNNTKEDWVQHSPNMALVSKCKTHSDCEYVHRSNVQTFEDLWEKGDGNSVPFDVGNKKKHGVTPRQTSEKMLVAEILSLAKVFVETSDRKFATNHIWDVLASVTTKLARSEKLNDESASAQEAENISTNLGDMLLTTNVEN